VKACRVVLIRKLYTLGDKDTALDNEEYTATARKKGLKRDLASCTQEMRGCFYRAYEIME